MKSDPLALLAELDPPPVLKQAVVRHYCVKGKKCTCGADVAKARRCGNNRATPRPQVSLYDILGAYCDVIKRRANDGKQARKGREVA
jgi:hypothetical protein